MPDLMAVSAAVLPNHGGDPTKINAEVRDGRHRHALPMGWFIRLVVPEPWSVFDATLRQVVGSPPVRTAWFHLLMLQRLALALEYALDLRIMLMHNYYNHYAMRACVGDIDPVRH
jgi:hypothetical protein